MRQKAHRKYSSSNSTGGGRRALESQLAGPRRGTRRATAASEADAGGGPTSLGSGRAPARRQRAGVRGCAARGRPTLRRQRRLCPPAGELTAAANDGDVAPLRARSGEPLCGGRGAEFDTRLRPAARRASLGDTAAPAFDRDGTSDLPHSNSASCGPEAAACSAAGLAVSLSQSDLGPAACRVYRPYRPLAGCGRAAHWAPSGGHGNGRSPRPSARGSPPGGSASLRTPSRSSMRPACLRNRAVSESRSRTWSLIAQYVLFSAAQRTPGAIDCPS